MYFSFFNTLIKGYLKYRHTRVEAMCLTPHLVQREVLQNLIKNLKKTQYGQKYNAYHINDYDTFNRHLPIVCYEDVFDYIDKMMAGKENILWPGRCKWFAKSSGTTNDKSKYIPITDENLFENHVAAGWDVVSIIYQNHPEAKIFDKKNLIMGGALSLHQQYSDIHVGDVSAILLDRMPAVGRPFYTPDFE